MTKKQQQKKTKKKKKTIHVLCYRTVSDSCKCLRLPVKINGKWTGSWLPVLYRKIYGYFLQCTVTCSASFLPFTSRDWNPLSQDTKMHILLVVSSIN